jgi:hypothetical protein
LTTVGPSSGDLAALAAELEAMARALAAASQPDAGQPGRNASLAGAEESSTGAGSPGPAGLDAVTVASTMAATAAAALRLSVERAREAGRTWQELGDVLGVSRQAAFQRFGHPVDPRTGQPMSNAILPGAAEKATELMINWIEERYDDVEPELGELTRQKLTELGGLPAAWAMVVGTVGAYEGMGEPMARQTGDLTIVDIPMTFETGEMNGRVVYDKLGKVAGLFVLPQGSL